MTSSRKASAAASAPRPRILAIDYGRRHLGLAVSDDLGITARPLLTLTRTNRRNDVRRLREIARENSVGRIVVGHPLNMDGTAGGSAQEAARFAARIQKELGLPVDLADERLSSWEAEQLRMQNAGRKKRSGTSVDDVAAAVILRDYLERNQTKKGSHRSRA